MGPKVASPTLPLNPAAQSEPTPYRGGAVAEYEIHEKGVQQRVPDLELNTFGPVFALVVEGVEA